MEKYALLLGYGIFDEKNEEYKKYVDEFARFVAENSIKKVILCGGKTSVKFPTVSEAESIAKYLNPKISGSSVMLVDESFTAYQNIKFAKRFINDISDSQITVFCDSIRYFKVMWFIMHEWFKMSRDQILKHLLDKVNEHYKKNIYDETTSMGAIIMKEVKAYKGVIINTVPIHLSVDAAVAQQAGSLLDIEALYDKSLDNKLLKLTVAKSGFK